ncbi:hypothetical protein HDU76_002059 [Blyttiomyces sp. JEL0837]|nr:hypothetical protein HDU76_002059 [Blyttiomyces sp. JEL0837]
MQTTNVWVDPVKFKADMPTTGAEAAWSDPKVEKLYAAADLEKTKLLKMARSGIPNHMRGKVYAKLLKVDKMDEFCPIVTTLTALMCHHMETRDEALGAMVSFVKQALHKDGGGGSLGSGAEDNGKIQFKDWKYFPTFRRDTKYMSRAFGNLLARQNSKLHHHIAELQTNHAEPVWTRWLCDMFVGALPLPVLWRILDAFMIDGYKTLFRVGVAMLVLQKDAIMKSTTLEPLLNFFSDGHPPVTPLFNSSVSSLPPPSATTATSATTPTPSTPSSQVPVNFTPVTTDQLLTTAWNIKVSTADIRNGLNHHSSLSAISQGDDIHESQYKYQRGVPKLKEAPIETTFHVPSSNTTSSTSATNDPGSKSSSLTTTTIATNEKGQEVRRSAIVKEDYWIALWSWIPPSMRLTELELVFTTRDHGHHVSTLFQKTSMRKPMILVVETENSVFGAYLSECWPEDDSQRGVFYGTGETFLFTLSPYAKLYPWIGRDEDLSETTNPELQDEAVMTRKTYIRDKASFFILATRHDITIGGGGHLSFGTTGPCTTFENDPLTGNQLKSFTCLNVEVFAFT